MQRKGPAPNDLQGFGIMRCFDIAGQRVCAVADMGMLELNEENVEMVLDEVRPYLMAGTGLFLWWCCLRPRNKALQACSIMSTLSQLCNVRFYHVILSMS